MRYKIKVRNDDAYQQALELLQGQTVIHVALPKRHLLATDDIPSAVRKQISDRLHAEIVEDHQYQAD